MKRQGTKDILFVFFLLQLQHSEISFVRISVTVTSSARQREVAQVTDDYFQNSKHS